METDDLTACPECDALLRKPPLNFKGTARCPRCAARLYRGTPAQLDPLCALTLGALITFIIAQSFPILEMDVNGVRAQTTLIGALGALWRQDMPVVALLVFCSTVLFPLIEMTALLYILIPLRTGVIPRGFHQVLRTIQLVRPWGMIEVLMVGILITIIKMTSLAHIAPNAALFAFAALTPMLAVVIMFEPRMLWEFAAAHGRRPPAAATRAGTR